MTLNQGVEYVLRRAQLRPQVPHLRLTVVSSACLRVCAGDFFRPDFFFQDVQ